MIPSLILILTSFFTQFGVNTLHRELKVPVTAKFRVFPTVEKTVEYARMLERAGAQILTCHGRLREQRGQNTGLADWAKIRAVKEAVSVPVFANGNILFHSDIERCLAETGADAVMSAEGQLYNPALFASASIGDSTGTDARRVIPRMRHTFDTGLHLSHADLALEYLEIVQGLETPTSLSAVKGHLFKLLRPALAREIDLRDELSNIRGPRSMERYMDVVREMKQRMDVSTLRYRVCDFTWLISFSSLLFLTLIPVCGTVIGVLA